MHIEVRRSEYYYLPITVICDGRFFKLDVTKVNKDELATLAEPDRQKRTVDEFCATQRMTSVGGNLDGEEEELQEEAAVAECDGQSSARYAHSSYFFA